MAYLTKQQYYRRSENAAARAIENEAIAVENGMTEEQAELISDLCAKRHKLHTSMDHIAFEDDEYVLRSLVRLNAAIAASGLPYVETIPCSEDDYIDIDAINELYDEMPSDDSERQDWIDDNYSRIYSELEQLNTDIEHYLADIDKQYHTHFCPTGALRVF